MKTSLVSSAFVISSVASAGEPINTSAPYTLEPGAVQIEGSAFDYATDKNNPAKDRSRYESWSIAPFTVRVGLASSFELQVGVEPLLVQHVKDRALATSTTDRGAGDTTLGLKLNLRGNGTDDTTAWGVLGRVKLPTADDAFGNGDVEGGVTLLMSTDFVGPLSLDFESDIGAVRNSADTAFRSAWSNYAALNCTITDLIELYVDATWAMGEGKPALSAGPGCTLSVSDRCELGCGVGFGLNRAADDLYVHADVAWKF